MNRTGKVLHAVACVLLATGCSSSTEPVRGPAGFVAVVDRVDGKPALFVQDLDGTNRSRIRFTGAVDLIPGNMPSPPMPPLTDERIIGIGPVRWSPDGSRLAAVVSIGADQSMVVVLNRDGTGARVASINSLSVPSGVEWSADGRTIAYVMNTNFRQAPEVFTTDLASNTVRQVTSASGQAFQFPVKLRFHSDGRLFTSRRSGQQAPPPSNFVSEIRQIDVATGASSVVASDLVGDVFGIARDGNWVLLGQHTALVGSDLRRQLVRRTLTSGSESVLAPSNTLAYAELDVHDRHSVPAMYDPSSSGSGAYTFFVLPLDGGPTWKLAGTTPQTFAVDVFFQPD